MDIGLLLILIIFLFVALISFPFIFLGIPGIIIFILIWVFFGLAFIASGIKILPEYQRAVVFRLGRFVGIRGPGVTWIWPIIEKFNIVDLRVQTIDVRGQTCITKDNIAVVIDAAVFFRIDDPAAVILKVQYPREAIIAAAQGTLRDIVGEVELDELLLKREEIAIRLQKALDEVTTPWGIKVIKTPISDIKLPETLLRAIARAAEAERERRAKVIAAKGELEAAKILAETAQYYEKHPWLLRLREFEVLISVAREKNTILLFPVDIGMREVSPALTLALQKRKSSSEEEGES